MKNFKILIMLLSFGFFFSCSNDLEIELPINEKSLRIDVEKILASDNSSLGKVNSEINPYLKDVRIALSNKDNIENHRIFSRKITYSVDEIINLDDDFKTLVFDILKMGDNSDFNSVLLKSRNVEKLILDKYPDSIEGDFLLKALAFVSYIGEKGIVVDFVNTNNRIMCGYECRWNLCMVTRLDELRDSNWVDQVFFVASFVWSIVEMELACLVDAADETYHCNKGYICD